MPQVIANITPDEHKALSQRAKANRRTLGNQLVAEAFASANLPIPEYLNAPAPAPAKSRKKKAACP